MVCFHHVSHDDDDFISKKAIEICQIVRTFIVTSPVKQQISQLWEVNLLISEASL